MAKDVPLEYYDSIFRDDALSGKFAFITGGGSGINFRITEAFMRHGCDVAIASRSLDRVKVASERLISKYPQRRCLYYSMDVSNAEAVKQTISSVLQVYPRIDILVNGAAGNFLCPAADLTPGGLKRVFEIDTFGSFNCTSEVFKQSMRDSSKPSVILNISAVLSRNGTMFQMHSGAAKCAIDSFTQHLAVEWGRYNVRVLSVSPGPIGETEGFSRLGGFIESEEGRKVLGLSKTETTLFSDGIPAGRAGTRKEIADACVFLASDASGFTTGVSIVIDGGQNMVSPNDLGRLVMNHPQILDLIPKKAQKKKKTRSKL